jgi:hypothetical protein
MGEGVVSRRSGEALSRVGMFVKGSKCSNSFLQTCERAWKNDYICGILDVEKAATNEPSSHFRALDKAVYG